MSNTISKDFEFSASHQLKGLPEDHPCSRLHGHNYIVRLEVTGEVNEIGFVYDYRAMSTFKEWLDTTFDHRHLNDVLDFNPTSEHMSKMMAHKALELVPFPDTIHRVSVSISETPKTWATCTVNILDEADAERYRWGGEGK